MMQVIDFKMVPIPRVELGRPKAQPPQDCVSTNSTISAIMLIMNLACYSVGKPGTSESCPVSCDCSVTAGIS